MVQVTIALEELSKEYPIDIPPYFALILRAFSVIEGTALRVDPDYAIVKETFPYLSRRLLTDNHPRARAALRQLLYGVSRACLDTRHRSSLMFCECVKTPSLVEWQFKYAISCRP